MLRFAPLNDAAPPSAAPELPAHAAPTAENVSLVATDERLAQLALQLSGRPDEPLALDTEADSFHHYFEKACLLQLGHGAHATLIDPLAPIDLAPLFAVLASRRLVLHGADYDLRLLYRGYGFRASSIFDTMIAAQILGEKELGLAALLGKRLGVVLDKSNQRADWSERPLSPPLITYAAADVLNLVQLASLLEADLAAAGRLEWHAEECERLVALPLTPKETDPENDWRLKGTNALSSQERAFARALFHARDERARETDRPPFRVLTNERLIEVAKRAAAGEASLAVLFPGPRPLPPVFLRSIARALEAARALPPAEWPPARRPTPYEANPPLERAIEALKKKRDALALALGLDPGFLASRALLTSAARAQLESRAPLDAGGLVEATGMSRWRAGILAGPVPASA